MEARKPGTEEKTGDEHGAPCFSWLHGFQIQNRIPPKFPARRKPTGENALEARVAKSTNAVLKMKPSRIAALVVTAACLAFAAMLSQAEPPASAGSDPVKSARAAADAAARKAQAARDAERAAQEAMATRSEQIKKFHDAAQAAREAEREARDAEREAKKAEEIAKAAHDADIRAEKISVFLREALKKTAPLANSLARKDDKDRAYDEVHALVEKAHDEFRWIKQGSPYDDARTTTELLTLQFRPVKSWDPRQVRETLEKAIKQLNPTPARPLRR
jgi:hypothetical protein